MPHIEGMADVDLSELDMVPDSVLEDKTVVVVLVGKSCLGASSLDYNMDHLGIHSYCPLAVQYRLFYRFLAIYSYRNMKN